MSLYFFNVPSTGELRLLDAELYHACISLFYSGDSCIPPICIQPDPSAYHVPRTPIAWVFFQKCCSPWLPYLLDRMLFFRRMSVSNLLFGIQVG